MKNVIKFGFLSLLLVVLSGMTTYTYADSGDNSGVDTGSALTGGTTGETGGVVTTYTVNFVTNGGGTLEAQVITGGEKLDTSAISVHRDGFSFSGWFIDSSFKTGFDIENDVVTSDLTLYAKWREHKIIVRYHPNGGKDERTGENPAKDPLRYSGRSVNCTTPCNPELFYTKTNWNGKNAAPNYTTSSSAWWLSKTGYVGHDYRLLGSTGADAKKVPASKRFSQNREIAQWVGMLEEFKAGDIEWDLYADWTPVNYTLTYTGLEGCTFEGEENPTIYTIESGDITLSNPSKTGYTFLGRSGTDIEGLSTGVVITGGSIENRNFEAVWQINSYTITYDIDGNNKIIVTGDYNTGVAQPQEPQRNGYKFLGWDTEIPEKMPAENITITAKWEKLGYSGAGKRSSSTEKDDTKDDGKDKADENKKSDDNSKSDDTGNQYKNSSSGTGNNSEQSDGKIDMDDLMNVYIWARDNGITTGETLEAALPDGYIERGEMAKLVVNFVNDVLGREVPKNIPSKCSRGDKETEWESAEEKKYAEQSCALGLMGIYMQNFKPNKLLDRAEFGTIVSRILWGEKFNVPNATTENKYYVKHLNEVKKEKLITKIDNPEAIKELRKWIWTVLKKIEG